METKHTKGEWKIVSKSKHRGWININSKKGIIARSFHGDMEPIVTVEEAEANVKLIAAAPDLLEALQSIVGTLENEGVSWRYENEINLAKNAIKKATE